MNSDLYGTLPFVPEITTESVSTTEMNITWTPVPGYNHSVILFDGNELYLHSNVWNSTLVPAYLHNLNTYAVIVMTTSKRSFGANFMVHWHEAGIYLHHFSIQS